MHTLNPLVVLSALTLVACVPDVGAGKVKAEVAETPTASPETASATATGTRLEVDRSRSKIGALGAKITATHPITWSGWEGSVSMDGESVTGVQFTVDMNTMEADHPKLTAHLKDPDFFDVPNHPTSTFRSVSITPGSDAEGDWTHTVEGDFTIRGKTKRIRFPAHIVVNPDAVTARTEFTIDRQDFGVSYPGMADDAVQDNVVMNISFVAPRS